jgi:hypothetical protein
MAKEGKTHYIKYNWISDDPRLIAKAKELADLRNAGLTRKSKRPFEDAFNVILTSFEVLGVYDGYELYVPTNTSLYQGKEQRNPAYTSEVLYALKFLINNLYLVKVADRRKAKRGNKYIWLPNRYTITSTWEDSIASEPLSALLKIRRNPLLPYTELRQDYWKTTKKGRQKFKKSIPIPSGQRSKHREMLDSTDKVLRAYDELMKASKTSLDNGVINPAQLSLTRVFSKGSLEQGGRLYSFIQSTKKKTRKYLDLNDEPTIEIDFWSIHPYLAYHSKGKDFPDEDPYIIEGYDRDTVKTAFNTMINRKAGGSKKDAAETLSKVLEIPLEEAVELEVAIKELHNPIAELFNSGIGLELQRTDSNIALKVLEYYIGRGIPIIPIHDSFIISVRYTEDLVLTMKGYYEEVLYGQDRPIDMMGFKGIKGEMREYSEGMNRAIQLSFRGHTEEMDDLYWDNLIKLEPVQVPSGLEVGGLDIEYE